VQGHLSSLMGQAMQLPDGHMQAQPRGRVWSWWKWDMPAPLSDSLLKAYASCATVSTIQLIKGH